MPPFFNSRVSPKQFKLSQMDQNVPGLTGYLRCFKLTQLSGQSHENEEGKPTAPASFTSRGGALCRLVGGFRGRR